MRFFQRKSPWLTVGQAYWVTDRLAFGPASAVPETDTDVVVHLHDVKVQHFRKHVTYQFSMVDGPIPENLGDLENLVAELVGHVRAGQRVLVCCEEGRNRSAFVAGLMLEQLEGLEGWPVVERLTAARLAILTNKQFRDRLLAGSQ